MKKTNSEINPLVLGKIIEKRIFVIRGLKVMLDSDLADLYGVETKYLKRAVSRNLERFPDHFMFELTNDEYENLRCQFVTSSFKSHGGSRYPPFVFTEQGVAMLSSVLNSKRAIHVNIVIMTTFVQMRKLAGTNKDVLQKIEVLERKYEGHDRQIKEVFNVMRDLVSPPHSRRRPIGIKNYKE